MARKKVKKQITNCPEFVGFVPEGIHSSKQESVDFLYEEFNAIELVDYKHMNFEQAAAVMNISKSSFARLIQGARRKVARAFVEGKSLKAEPGDNYSDYNWYRCEDCYHVSKHEKPDTIDKCPSCESLNLKNMFLK